MPNQEENSQITDAVTSAVPTSEETFADELASQVPDLSDAIKKARAQEKAKLYPQLEKLQEEISILRKEREEQAAINAERNAKRAEREAQKAAEKKAQEEDEMSFKTLLKTKEAEWAEKLEAERLERERTFALLQREREYQELDAYRRQRLEQERDNIAPELIDLVAGNTKDELEASITVFKDRSTKIFENLQQVAQQSRKEMVGARVTAPASGPLDNDSASNIAPNDIANMSMADYAKNRAKLLNGGQNRGQGLFG